LLLTLLVIEAALVVSLREFGWFETGTGLRWLGCLAAAIVPLVMAAVVLFRDRFRFNLRSLLVAMALVATFLFITVRPLQNAISSRRASQSMLATGATLHTVSTFDNVYTKLNYDPRLPVKVRPVNQELPFWLRPLAGGLQKVPVDDSVKEIWLTGDEQIAQLCREPGAFRILERISIIGQDISKAHLEILRQTLPEFTHLTDIHLSEFDVSPSWLRSLSSIRTLVLWRERQRAPTRLSDEQLHAVATLPELRVLMIYGYAATDANIEILSGSKTLKHLILRQTAVTESGRRQLELALPDCVVYRN
jgi:hypothetical protein